MKNIKKFSEILKIVKDAKNQGKKVVTTNGTYDILHIGHVRNLEFAKKQGDILIVGINSDSSVRAYKGKNRPIIPEGERAEMVAALSSVDYVFIFKEKASDPWLRKLRPHIHVKGQGRNLEKETLKAIGAKFIFAPLVAGKSSTNIIEKIKK